MRDAGALGLGPIFLAAMLISFAFGILVYGLIDWIFIDDVIRSKEPIAPKIEKVKEAGKDQQIYIYKAP